MRGGNRHVFLQPEGAECPFHGILHLGSGGPVGRVKPDRQVVAERLRLGELAGQVHLGGGFLQVAAYVTGRRPQDSLLRRPACAGLQVASKRPEGADFCDVSDHLRQGILTRGVIFSAHPAIFSCLDQWIRSQFWSRIPGGLPIIAAELFSIGVRMAPIPSPLADE